jgi:hypothetical protein
MGQGPGYLVFGVFDSGHDGSSAEEKVIFQGTEVLCTSLSTIVSHLSLSTMVVFLSLSLKVSLSDCFAA